MKSGSDFDLSALMANPAIRDKLARTLGKMGLDHVSQLATVLPRGRRSGVETPVKPTREALALALRDTFVGKAVDECGTWRDWVIENATLSVVNGSRRLHLTTEARAVLLDAPGAAPVLHDLLQSHAEIDSGLLQRGDLDLPAMTELYMRVLLRGPDWYERAHIPHTLIAEQASISISGGYRLMQPGARQALTEARRLLAEVRTLPEATPSLAECERLDDLADLLDPLGLMLGIEQGRYGQGEDRFVGRKDLLTELRGFVDALKSETSIESIGRAFGRVKRSIQSGFGTAMARMMTLQADGGMGKSTVIAKFLMDHALSEDSPFPFAILDFDRAALQPRNPAGLLLEIARQIALQFPGFAERIEEFACAVEDTNASAKGTDLRERLQVLRALIDDVLRETHAPCFLLTLDTLELVENDPRAIDAICGLLEGFAEEGNERLVVVVAGRAGPQEIASRMGSLYEVTQRDLPVFSVREARRMVRELGEHLLGKDWHRAWEAPLVGPASAPPVRREPLTLRLAVEIIRNAPPGDRARLVADIGVQGSETSENFVGGLYMTRVIGHIPDADARQLALSGLVVRRMTRQLAETVLAPLCDLSPERAGQAFERLARESWIAERDGDTLHHHRELRARTLPLMRRQDPELFGRVLDALIVHYGPGPRADGVEELYYRLLRGDEDLIRRAAEDEDVLREIATARDDFPPGSTARIAVDAVSGRRLLPPEHLATLPPRLLWRHAARTAQVLRSFNDVRIDPRVVHLTTSKQPWGDTAARAVWQFMQIKCGCWDKLDPERLEMPQTRKDTTLFAFYARSMSLGGEVAPGFFAERYPEMMGRIAETRATKNWRAMAEALPVIRRHDRDLAGWMDDKLAEIVHGQQYSRRSAEIGLRSLMIHGRSSWNTAFPAWCAVEAARVRGGVSSRELRVLAPLLESEDLVVRHSLLDRILRGERGQTGAVLNVEALEALSTALHGLATRTPTEKTQYVVAEYCAIRQPQWIVPFAYLLMVECPGMHRALRDRIAPLIRRTTPAFNVTAPKSVTLDLTDDYIQMLDVADRMGRFDEAVSALLARTGPGGRFLNRIRLAAPHL